MYRSPFTTKTYTWVHQQKEQCLMDLHCLRWHFQDLGLQGETDGNSFPLAGVAGLLKTSLKCQRNVRKSFRTGPNACKGWLEELGANKCSIDKSGSDSYPKGFGGWQSWGREGLFTLVGPSENFLILITVTLFCACQPTRRFESQPDLLCVWSRSNGEWDQGAVRSKLNGETAANVAKQIIEAQVFFCCRKYSAMAFGCQEAVLLIATFFVMLMSGNIERWK